jgi:DGQHR domain-containing protein
MMLTLPALKVQQFNQEFYLLNLAAQDVERLVRFEVLGDAGLEGKRARARASKSTSLVNWTEIEKKVQTSDKAYQRPIMRKKIEELARYYVQCKDDGAVPALPGALLVTTDCPVEFVPEGINPFVGVVRLPINGGGDDGGVLRVLDGQHRLLALSALLHSEAIPEGERHTARLLQVPALLFPGLPPPSVVEMFVTINSKHTRLNPSLLFSLKGRQLYADPLDARIHDAIRKLNEAESSPLRGRIKMLGVGPGRIAQAGLAQELRRAIDALGASHGGAAWFSEMMEHIERLYLVYFKEIARVFSDAWDSRSHSIQSLIALRAFIQASQSVLPKVMEAGGDPRQSTRALLAPWAERIGSSRFETAGTWRQKAAGGGKETTRVLARELASSLGDPS